MEVHLKTLGSSLVDCLAQPVQGKLASWRKKVVQIDRDHAKQFKKMNTIVKKKKENVGKLRKKVKKKAKDQELLMQLEVSEQDLHSTLEVFVEKETKALRDIQTIERFILGSYASGWKQVVAEEFCMLNQIERLSDVMDQIGEEALLPISRLEHKRYQEDYAPDDSQFQSTTTLSPYTAKSRSESCKSRTSVSSRHSSVDSCLDDRRSSSLSWCKTQSHTNEYTVEDSQRHSIYQQEQQDDCWISCYESTVVKPSLPERGMVPEPHYSVPKNNARVVNEENGTEEVSVDEGDKKEDTTCSDTCSSGYSSNEVQNTN